MHEALNGSKGLVYPDIRQNVHTNSADLDLGRGSK
jgi:hypothetical protein